VCVCVCVSFRGVQVGRLVKGGSEERRVGGGMVGGGGRWWMYWLLCRCPGILLVCACGVWLCGVCVSPVSWGVYVCCVEVS